MAAIDRTTTNHPQQFLLDTRDLSAALRRGYNLYAALIQMPCRKWEHPWRHQRAIVLFAAGVEEFRVRLKFENRLRVGEHLLSVTEVAHD